MAEEVNKTKQIAEEVLDKIPEEQPEEDPAEHLEATDLLGEASDEEPIFEDAETNFPNVDILKCTTLIKSPQYAPFTDACQLELVAWVRSICPNKPFFNLRTWFNKNTVNTVALNGWPELIKVLIAVIVQTPRWSPTPFCGERLELIVHNMLLHWERHGTLEEQPVTRDALEYESANHNPGMASTSGASTSGSASNILNAARKQKARVPPEEPEPTDMVNAQQATFLKMLMNLAEKVETLNAKVSMGTDGASSSDSSPSLTTTERPVVPANQAEVNQAILHSLKILHGDEPKTTPPPKKVFAKYLLEQILEVHDFPQANSKQKAATSAAKALKTLYELGYQLTSPDDKLFPVAVLITSCIQSALCADAFLNDAPYNKGRVQLLSEVMKGTTTSKQDLKNAYADKQAWKRGTSTPQRSWKPNPGRGQGPNRWNQKRRPNTGKTSPPEPHHK